MELANNSWRKSLHCEDLEGYILRWQPLRCLEIFCSGMQWVDRSTRSGRYCHTWNSQFILKASHVTRTQRPHQVTASSLYLLLKRAYTEYSKDLEHVMSLEDWHTITANESPQFRFWSIILNLELHVMIYVRAI